MSLPVSLSQTRAVLSYEAVTTRRSTRELSHHVGRSEAKLWEALHGGQLGVHFKRQVRIGEFIADFFAPAAKLIVEVDGGAHVGRGAADARRDRKLERLGYRVVRVEAELVLGNLAGAMAVVRAGLAI